MLKPLLSCLLVVVLAACGEDICPSSQPSPQKGARVQVQAWHGNSSLAANKGTIVSTLQREGADNQRIALVLACAMAETTDISGSQRDMSKDGAGMAKNFTAYNMNAYALQKLGWSEGTGADINNDLSKATSLFNQGINTIGETKWLCLHRGGETAMNDGVSYGAQDYIHSIYAIRDYLLSDTSRFWDANRYAMEIAHV